MTIGNIAAVVLPFGSYRKRSAAAVQQCVTHFTLQHCSAYSITFSAYPLLETTAYPQELVMVKRQ